MERSRRAELLLLSVLALAPAAAPAQAGEPVVVRLNDAVGDTLDRAERDSFQLFPNTAGFQRAVILALPGPEFFAEVALASADSTRDIFLRIMPNDLDRIRFLIDNRELVGEQQGPDSTYTQALASFWRTIEDHPLRSIAGELAVAQKVRPALTEAAPVRESPEAHDIEPGQADTATDGSQPQPATIENRYNYAMHGTALGSIAGGYLGSAVGIKHIGYANAYYIECGPGGNVQVPVYTINQPLFWTAACGLTALGSTAGYLIGAKADREMPRLPSLPNEGKTWRYGCAVGAAVPGVILGTLFAVLVGGRYYGKIEPSGEIENDREGTTMLPMVLTGLCIAVELTTIGYLTGRDIDRENARKAEAKRQALGR